MQTFIFILFSLLILLVCGFTLKLLLLVKKNDYSRTISFFSKYIIFIILMLLIFYIVTLIASLIAFSDYIVIAIAKSLVSIIYFATIYTSTRTLLKNLKNEIIFDDQNVTGIQRIGANFIYLTITEIIGGILFGIILVLSGVSNTFTLNTNFLIFAYITIGIILLIVSFILKKAIEIDKENKLTI